MDHVKMCDMEFYGFTGCLPEEKEKGQVFVVTCDMGFEGLPGARTDELSGTVDYSEVYELIKDIVSSSRGNLIENLAYRLVECVLGYSELISEVSITVSKPSAPVDGVFRTMETTITRRRGEI